MKFRFADQITFWKDRSEIRGYKAVSFEEYCLRSPLGYPEALPESLILESFYSFADWLVMLSTGYSQILNVNETEKIEYIEPVNPGMRMMVSVRFNEFKCDGVAFNASGIVDGRMIANLSGCSASLLPLNDYRDPDDMKTLFSEIFKPESGVNS